MPPGRGLVYPDAGKYLSYGSKRRGKLSLSPAADQHPMIARMGALAKELKVWILLGSVAVKLPDGKLHNRSIMFDANGDIVAKYNKIHLFDVDLPTGETHRESDVDPARRSGVIG